MNFRKGLATSISILLTAPIMLLSSKHQNNVYASYVIDDVKTLQSFLLSKNDNIQSVANFDLNQDNILNALDLCLMKRQTGNNLDENNIYVSSVDELKYALLNATAGDTILLESGVYESVDYGIKASLFYSPSEGTESNPITIKSIDPENPAILKGTDLTKSIVLYITGDYWNIEDIICCYAQKGIVLDNSNYSVIKNVEVYDTGLEGIHLRDGSSYCEINGANVHDNGLVSEYGEAIYIGSAKSTTEYAYDCNYNLVKNCVLGPNTVAECVDIKEYTTGNIIEGCTMYGTGMTATDSFIDIKGNETIVRNNICYDQGNPVITDAFQVHSQVDGWGKDNFIHDNIVYLDNETAYILKAWSGSSCTVQNNVRNPYNSDYMYRGYSGSELTILDE